MPKTYSARETVSAFKKYGFEKVSQRGSHLKMRKGARTIIIPIHNKDIPFGTFKSILEQAGISYADFLSIR